MKLFTTFLIFVVIWWIIFFMILPLKVSIPKKQAEGHANSAPKKTYIGIKVFITTILSLAIMFLLILFNFELSMIFKK